MKNIFSDRELWFILAFNLMLAVGYQYDVFSMDTLVWIFYFQSILIGLGNTFRLAFMRDFTTNGFKINGEEVQPTRSTKRFGVVFFTLHYNFFHFVYFIFLVMASLGNGSKIDFRLLWINVIIMAGNTIISTWSNILKDREDPKSMGALFFTPYLRVVPMHLFIMLGFNMKVEKMIAGIKFTPHNLFWAFLILKIVSDALMHIVTQQSWKEKRIHPTGGFI
ncbi:MAG: hypothetical protein H6605_02960 [Flavobacteriales bacterium]|nr:hypothetical protein [Flavobacteriales bacterium]